MYLALAPAPVVPADLPPPRCSLRHTTMTSMTTVTDNVYQSRRWTTPTKLELRYGMPQLQIPVELVILHLAMLAFLEKYQVKSTLRASALKHGS